MTLFLSHLDMLKHGRDDHPECAERLRAILNAFSENPLKDYLDLSILRYASIEELVQVHDENYVKKVFSLINQEAYLDPETVLSKDSVPAALLAAGLGIELVERVVEKKTRNGFVFVRPPGHHARPAAGMGFCVFNNIAIAAKKALEMGIKRLLILDWDVHHGNGTQETFYSDERVLFIDIHQENLFPLASGPLNDMGEDKGKGLTVNVPLPPTCGNQEYLYVFDHLIRPLAKKFAPELILVSAGFDAHESDPMGFMKLTTHGYELLARRTKMLADDCCDGKVIFFLEGGYNPFFLAKNALACAEVLLEDSPVFSPEEEVEASNEIKKIISDINRQHIGLS